MMKRIYKYPLEITDEQSVELPICSQFISVRVQNDAPVLYALVDLAEPINTVKIHIYGTGNPIPDMDREFDNYIDTVSTHNGRFVWHVFYVTDLPF